MIQIIRVVHGCKANDAASSASVRGAHVAIVDPAASPGGANSVTIADEALPAAVRAAVLATVRVVT
jgi:hypothetical protein